MTPLKFSDIVDDFCLTMGYDKEDSDKVKLILAETYTDLKEHMHDMEYDFINMPGIGEFFTKGWTLVRAIKPLEKLLTDKRLPYAALDVIRARKEKIETAYARTCEIHKKKVEKQIAGVIRVREGRPAKEPMYEHIPNHVNAFRKPNYRSYTQDKCRCIECIKANEVHNKKTRDKIRKLKELKQQIKKEQDELKGKADESLGEQESDS